MKTDHLRTVVSYLCLSIFVGTASEAESKLLSDYISDSPSASVPAWIAKETGIFNKSGLDIDLVFFDGSTRGIQSLLAGDLSFTEAVGTSAINGRIAGGDIAIVNGVINTLPYYVVGKPVIKSRDDLKGRTAAVHIPGTAADFALRLALKKVGIAYNQIQAITVGGGPARITSVIGGQTDFTVVSDAEKIQGEKAGLKVVIDMAELKVPFLYTCTVTSRQLIREQPDTVRRMVVAIAAGINLFKTRKEESIKIMSKYTRGPSRTILEGAYSAYSQLFVDDTYPTLEGLRNTLEVQSSWDPKAARAKAEDFVDLRFVDQLRSSGFIDKLYGRK
jgi:ABC-type nitrate/sulfonate/bicarbonate transport system substrate-binding protein